jgi:hypothetical protein
MSWGPRNDRDSWSCSCLTLYLDLVSPDKNSRCRELREISTRIPRVIGYQWGQESGLDVGCTDHCLYQTLGHRLKVFRSVPVRFVRVGATNQWSPLTRTATTSSGLSRSYASKSRCAAPSMSSRKAGCPSGVCDESWSQARSSPNETAQGRVNRSAASVLVVSDPHPLYREYAVILTTKPKSFVLSGNTIASYYEASASCCENIVFAGCLDLVLWCI